ncbi:MAG: hypothetical protein IKT38_04370 [Clostridia bacterium]|nr:hypothetical protein [Clostridia bacterium]
MENNELNQQSEIHYEPAIEDIDNEKKSLDVLGLISMILSICNLPLVCCGICGNIVSVIFCIAAIVLSLVSKKQNGKFSGFALTGLIISIISLVFLIVFIVLAIVLTTGQSILELILSSY